MHAISNSEDVPCTKWPPARRSKGVEKRWYIRDATHRRWRVKVGPEGAIFRIFAILSVDSRVRVTQYGGAFEEAGPNKTVAQVKWWLVVVRWWRV